MAINPAVPVANMMPSKDTFPQLQQQWLQYYQQWQQYYINQVSSLRKMLGVSVVCRCCVSVLGVGAVCQCWVSVLGVTVVIINWRVTYR